MASKVVSPTFPYFDTTRHRAKWHRHRLGIFSCFGSALARKKRKMCKTPNYVAGGSGCEVLWWVCLSVCACVPVCLSARISPEPHAWSLPNFLYMLPVSVARSSSDMFTIGRIAYRREGVFFPTKMRYRSGKGMGVHSAGEVYYLRLPC